MSNLQSAVTEVRSLQHDFTPQEIHDLSMQLAHKTTEHQAKTEEKNRANAAFAAELKEISKSCHELAEKVTNGHELRDVTCEVRYHHPQEGQKTILRSDTNEEMVQSMTAEELQNLFNQPQAVKDNPSHREGGADDDDEDLDPEEKDDFFGDGENDDKKSEPPVVLTPAQEPTDGREYAAGTFPKGKANGKRGRPKKNS